MPDGDIVHDKLPRRYLNGDIKIDLAAAIHASDRLVPNLGQRQRDIRVVLPVRHPEVFERADILSTLTELLHWATANRWFFEPVKRESPGRLV